MMTKGDSRRGQEINSEFGINIQTTIYKIGKQGPTVDLQGTLLNIL